MNTAPLKDYAPGARSAFIAAVRGQAAQLALGLGVAFIYLALQKTIEPLGYVQTIPPVVAAWLPHLVFALVAVLLLARANR